ncbi:GTPase ObgE [Streptobacillus moniliformis]|uniref:GTPase Obg n=1 Tax=Streptobacillus moniliformis (strain ATCC 14647 / DSM 12112 / NCTC 10651 / 9901) TaxID=519441 RepID=D1AWX0_STRM9|nr:GTPase ObgE [Streptobacillus moniliformis]ACZ00796.1 GTP-binding protein Obg/CgtA [Streptobacillus moniliformis DSM 12112]AVL42807.1 GTPase ObgE [Streptobacillus moniliformis]SQA14069.1 GTP-binding protein obg [Streptobacillus moniliformis]
MFIDESIITIKSGKGGDGAATFRREKFVQFGGPDGGDGGKGGDIIFIADPNINTLVDFKTVKMFEAEDGQRGSGARCKGASGKNCIIKVPVGTMIRDYETDKLLVDLDIPNEEIVLLKGGDGGRGNIHFKSSIRKAPKIAESGREGMELKIKLELKLLADVALVGYPSVGKSSFINKVSAANSKVAEYHFTTLKPKLGVVRMSDEESFVIADIPGLIEGAHEGVGLGDRFLKHIQRCKTIVHIIDFSGIEGREPIEDFEKINNELFKFSERLSKKEQIVFANKLDMVFDDREDKIKEFKNELIKRGIREENIVFGSIITGENLKELLTLVWNLVKTTEREIIEEEPDLDLILPDLIKKQEDWIVEKLDEEVYELKGQIVDNVLRKYVLLGEDGIIQFLQIMRKLGMEKILEKHGVVEGDTIIIAGYEFTYVQ